MKNAILYGLLCLSVLTNAVVLIWVLAVFGLPQWVESGNIDNYLYDHLSIQIAIFEGLLVLLGVVFGVVTFVGYDRIKQAAVKEARRDAERQLKKYFGDLGIPEPRPSQPKRHAHPKPEEEMKDDIDGSSP